jgi:hypothetical protein
MANLVTEDNVRLASEPIALIGPPRACKGMVRVHNPRREAVRLKRLMVHTAAEPLASCAPGGAIALRVSAPLCAGETRAVRVRLALPPGTPPGEYQAWLTDEGKQRCSVSIQVLERRRMRLVPNAVGRTASPGETFTVRAVASNCGNVPVVIPARVAVELHAADRGFLSHFHGALRSDGDEGHGHFLDAFVARMARDEPPLARARVTLGAGPLAAQDSRVVELEVKLPKQLRRRRTYQAIVRLGDARLRLTLRLTSSPRPAGAVR